MAVRIWKGHDTETDTGPEHFDITWEGKVLATGEHNYWDDSDFYAIVWDDQQQAPREVGYATTRGWTYYNSATVDATPEINAAWKAWQATQRAARAAEQARIDAATPAKGKRVRVVKGRKVPHGTVGDVFWYGPDKYARPGQMASPPMRVGIRADTGQKYFTAATNVEVI